MQWMISEGPYNFTWMFGKKPWGTNDYGHTNVTAHPRDYGWCAGCVVTLGQADPTNDWDGNIVGGYVFVNSNSGVPWAVGTPTSTQLSLVQLLAHELATTSA